LADNSASSTVTPTPDGRVVVGQRVDSRPCTLSLSAPDLLAEAQRRCGRLRSAPPWFRPPRCSAGGAQCRRIDSPCRLTQTMNRMPNFCDRRR
jgi:hypothetical protein